MRSHQEIVGASIDINKIKNNGYRIEICALGVSSLNSLLSVFERYETQINKSCKTAKLTEIKRHDDSFESLSKYIKDIKNMESIQITVFRRGKDKNFTPVLFYDSETNNKNYSCPFEALSMARKEDEKETLINFMNRYKLVLKSMEQRNAPIEQIQQLETVLLRYNELINNMK